MNRRPFLSGVRSVSGRRMERAIEAGHFVWLGLPCSAHSELMDWSLARLATAMKLGGSQAQVV